MATKWGYTFRAEDRETTGTDGSPDYLRAREQALELASVCDELVAAGLIRAYGWSTDDASAMAAFAERSNAAAVQFG